MGVKRLNQEGMTIVELLIAVGIMAALASSVVLARQFVAKQTQNTSDKIFATQKAIQMYEELRSLAAQGGQNGFLTLDNYNDGSSYKDVLTTDQNVSSPSDPLSANKNIGYWKFWRQVSVVHLTQDPFARIVNVRVYGGQSGNKADPGNLLAEVGGILRITYTPKPPTQVYDVYALALSNELGWFTEVPNMLTAFENGYKAVTTLNPGLAINYHEISQTAFGRDFFYNPYINQTALSTASGAYPWIYFYIGLTPETSGANAGTASDLFFSPTQLEAVGGINVDGTIKNDNGYSMADMYDAGMRYPDEVAAYQAVSQYQYQQAVSQGTYGTAGYTPYQMTLRMLLETMCTQPASILNPLLISMHGEVLPLINMHNYSDAAKDPLNASGAGGPNIRVVAHPDLVHYPSNPSLAHSHPVSLRVYAYYDGLLNPGLLSTSASYAPGNVASTITVYFPSLELKTTDLTVTAISGGVSAAGATFRYYSTNIASGSGNATMGMYWTMGNPNTTDTCVTLFNTPLRCESVSTTGPVTTGLLPSQLLYNTEYIPCAVDTNTNYNTNLTSTNQTGPVNTARWIISFTKANGVTIPDGQYAVETRLGGYPTTVQAGVTYFAGDYGGSPSGPVPSGSAAASELMADLSRTYLWLGEGSNSSVTWGGSGITPFTERYQYNGDPRHEPYLDCKFGSVAMGTTETTAGGVTIDANCYNWYFRQIGSDNGEADGYSGFLKTTAGYNGNPTAAAPNGDMRDMPRYYYTYRNALLQSSGVFTNLNGWTCWHADEGGEFGGTYDPFANSISITAQPFNPPTTGPVSIDEIQTTNNYIPSAYISATAGKSPARVVIYNSAESLNPTNTWYAKSWIGEIYPDSTLATPVTVTGTSAVTNYAAAWVSFGNLPVSQFWQVPYEAVSSTLSTGVSNNNGFDTARHCQWGVGSNSPAGFLNGVSSSGTSYSLACDGGAAGVDDESDITQLGLNIYNTTNFVMGSPVSAANTRPWSAYFDLHQDPTKLPPTWGDSYYSGLRTTLSVPNVPSSINSNAYNRIIYTSEDTNETGDLHNPAPVTWNTLGVVEMDYVPTAGTTQTAYFNLSGLAPSGASGVQVLAQTGINTMLRTFLDGGILHSAGTHGHIAQLPLFQVSTNNSANQFTNPSAVTLSWSSPVSWPSGTPVTQTLWTRWAGSLGAANWYTEEYPNYNPASLMGGPVTNSTYVEPVTIFYVPMFSTNEGVSWVSCMDDTTTMTPGNYYAPAANATTQMSVTWSTPASQFPQQTYSVRVDGFRQGYPLHYSYHEVDDISFTR